MTTVYALLVGVDRYAGPAVPRLAGCVNDVDAVLALLTTTSAGTTIEPRVLRNEAATVAAVVDGLRTHLTKAGPDDTALFWFSGHGSQEDAPKAAWFIESTGMLQTLVCHDSRHAGVPDLWDKELSVLLDAVAERAGHVAVVLDSCHSEGGTRQVGSRWRAAPPAPARDPGSFLPELIARNAEPGAPVKDHVALAACRRDQQAEERVIEGLPRGLFTWSLLQSLHRLARPVTYRELLTAARGEVARQRAYAQVPQLYPAESELADLVFLRGAAGAAGTGMDMTHGLDGWQINAGLAHGLPADPAGLRFRVKGTTHEVRVVLVRPDRTLVAPLHGWRPTREQQFAMVLSALPRPLITVAADSRQPPPAEVQNMLRTDLVSGYVRSAEPDESAALTVGSGPLGVRVTDRQGYPTDLTAEPDQVRAALEHMGRWLRLLELRNDATALGEPIRLDIVAAEGDPIAPRDRPALEPRGDGAYHLEYTRTASGWSAPEIFIRLHNPTDKQLYVTLLDLTPRYAAHAKLFPVAPIGAGRDAAALEGRRIQASLPAGDLPAPGRAARDWLLLVVSELPFDADPYRLPPLARSGTRGDGLRDLGDSAPPSTSGEDWTVQRYELIIEVPGDQNEPPSARNPSGSSTVIVR